MANPGATISISNNGANCTPGEILANGPCDPFVYGYTLINAVANAEIGPLVEGDEIDLTYLPTDRLNILAHTWPEQLTKVAFDLNAGFFAQADNNPPFCMARDNQNGGFYQFVFPLGAYTMTTTPYVGMTPMAADVLNFTVVQSPLVITGFEWFDTGPTFRIHEPSEYILGELKDGDVVDLANFPSNELNIHAKTEPVNIGSVWFDLNGGLFAQYDNNAPYTLARDSYYGTHYGFAIYPYTFSPGAYTLTATPYSKKKAMGDAGISTTINFTIIDSNSPSRQGLTAENVVISPNPTTGKLNLRFVNVKGGDTDLQIFDLQGRLVQSQTLAVQAGSSEQGIQVHDLPQGIYLLSCRINRQRFTTRFVKY